MKQTKRNCGIVSFILTGSGICFMFMLAIAVDYKLGGGMVLVSLIGLFLSLFGSVMALIMGAEAAE